MNKAKLLKLARLIREPIQDEVPDGYFSREQLQEAFKMGKEQTCKVIRDFIQANQSKVAMRKLRRKNSSGTISIIPYYKIDL
jgi:hypothetical protein